MSNRDSFTADSGSRPDRSGWRWVRRTSTLLRVGVLTYLIVLLLLVIMEERLVYLARPYPWGDWNKPSPNCEEVYFTSADGTNLHGWYLNHRRPRAHILYCHGSGDNVGHLGELLRFLHERLNVSVFAFDYRGYGRSEGSPDEAGILADARAARAWLARRAEISEYDIVLLGRSLGGGVAVDLAADLPPRGLILESTFTSLPDAAAVQYPWVPTWLVMRNRLDSLSKIGHYRGPLLQSHGDADRIVPFEQGRQLYWAAPGRKQFVTIAGGRHNDAQPIEYYKAMSRFLRSLQLADSSLTHVRHGAD